MNCKAYGMCITLFLIWFVINFSPVDVQFVQTMQDNKCRTSVDSLLDAKEFAFSLRSKGLLLHSAATAQSTMDYSTMAMDEGVVDSPIPRVPIPDRVDSPSPVWPISAPESPISNRRVFTATKRTLYAGSKEIPCSITFTVSFYPRFQHHLWCFLDLVHFGLIRVELY